ncbi:hypothetical protein C0W54_05600 [Photobacterium kishitanii]|uniref:hypothetical protein n=1 Tax=Photobacterium kishitanii TaxID=318456 RepID=UPI000D177FC0|nr:hypothetical protein [Photobacterium kishitanii]PSW62985.1 hypothetical protein C0W54_05600 [Photobacterium kishitanii]
MLVSFNLFKNKLQWHATLHQLNSDVLLRHVLIQGDVDDINISFSYCEDLEKGMIKNNENESIGYFQLLTNK